MEARTWQMNSGASLLTVILEQVNPLPLFFCQCALCYCDVLSCVGFLIPTPIFAFKEQFISCWFAKTTFLWPVTKVECGEALILNPVTEVSPEDMNREVFLFFKGGKCNGVDLK